MKKSIIALMGLFTLVACSEDSYQEADKLNEAGAIENAGSQNSVRTIDSPIGYHSPYQIGEAAITHRFMNDTGLELYISAYIGLAYDDMNPTSPLYNGFDLSNGDYPNLYNGGLKYGNVIKSDPFLLDQLSGRFSNNGCSPIFHDPTLANDFNFSFGSIYTIEELKLLNEYGKIYYMEYEARIPGGGSVGNGFISSGFTPGIGSTFGWLPGNWQYVAQESNYSRDLLSEVTSKEIVVGEEIGVDFPSVIPVGANTLRTWTDANAVYLWFH